MIKSLAESLSALDSETQEYTFLVAENTRDWLANSISGSCRLLVLPTLMERRWRDRLRNIAPVRRAARRILGNTIPLPVSDGTVERLHFDLVLFPTQVAYITAVPSIYQPWDLQHIHHPDFFNAEDVRLRDRLYRAFCQQAACVCVSTEWTRQDLMQQFGIPKEKIELIRWGSNLSSGGILPAPASDLDHVSPFFFYPAATWPHKNHELIVRAAHRLKQNGRVVHLYFTGHKGNAYEPLMALVERLGMSDQVKHLGYLDEGSLRRLYERAAAMVFPSRFEGLGLPILEAFQMNTPVLCSQASVLPETALDGAAYFHPDSEETLAELMIRILDEPGFGAHLAQRGREVLKDFTMRDTALAYQRLFEKVASERVSKGMEL